MTSQETRSLQDRVLEQAVYALATPLEALRLARRARGLALADGDVRLALAASKYIATRCLLLRRWATARREARGLLLAGSRMSAAVILGECALGDGRSAAAATALLEEELAATPPADPDTEGVARSVLRRLGGGAAAAPEPRPPEADAPMPVDQGAALRLRSEQPLTELLSLVARPRSPWRVLTTIAGADHHVVLTNDTAAASSLSADLAWLLRMSSAARRRWRSALARRLEIPLPGDAESPWVAEPDLLAVLAELAVTIVLRPPGRTVGI